MSEEKFTFFWKSPLGQWHIRPMVIQGVTYNCCEQFMMAQKAILFKDVESLKKIMHEPKPSIQQDLGRNVQNYNEDAWNAVAREVIYTGNLAKFTQHEDLREKLLATAGTTLVEASPDDLKYGIGLSEKDDLRFDRKNWRGTNWLGETLTRVREEIISRKVQAKAKHVLNQAIEGCGTVR